MWDLELVWVFHPCRIIAGYLIIGVVVMIFYFCLVVLSGNKLVEPLKGELYPMWYIVFNLMAVGVMIWPFRIYVSYIINKNLKFIAQIKKARRG